MTEEPKCEEFWNASYIGQMICRVHNRSMLECLKELRQELARERERAERAERERDTFMHEALDLSERIEAWASNSDPVNAAKATKQILKLARLKESEG